MTKNTRRQAPDERAATDRDVDTSPPSPHQPGTTKNITTTPSYTCVAYETQTAPPENPLKAENNILEQYCPTSTALAKHVKQSSLVKKTPQHPHNLKHITTQCADLQIQKTCSNKRKYSEKTLKPKTYNDATGDTLTSDAQQHLDELKIHQLKRTKDPHPNSPNTNTPIQRNPTNNPSRRNNLKPCRRCLPQHPVRGPIHLTPIHLTPPPPPPTHSLSQNHHHTTSTEAREPEKDFPSPTTTNLPNHNQPPHNQPPHRSLNHKRPPHQNTHPTPPKRLDRLQHRRHHDHKEIALT